MLYYKLLYISVLLTSKVVSAAPSRHGHPQIQWGPCDPSVVNDTSLSCGFLDVPLDYHNPSVGNAHLAIVKANATGERRGSVLFNPGGPGDSGVSDLGILKELLLQLTGGVYDIISWDPRGVGTLTIPGEIFCFESLEEYTTFFNGTIELTGIEETGNFTDPADVDALLAEAPTMQKKYEELGKKCLNSPNGRYLEYIGTAAAVRDMISIANAIDGPDAPINYFGTSYGSLLGSWFVNMFPERVGRVIINGVPNPVTFATQKPSIYFAHQLVSADTIYKAMLTGCALAGPSACPAASEDDGPLDIDAKFQALLKAAHDAARAGSSVPLTSGQIRVALAGQMYAPAGWARFMNETYPQLVQIVNGESQGNSNDSLTRRSEGIARRSQPLKRTASNGSPSYSIHAITCGDAIDLHGVTMEEQFKGIIDTARNISHMFGASWPAPDYLCGFWPVRSVERYQGPFSKKLANKIIVASNVYDPVTPLAGAEAIASQLGEDAVLVRQNGFGHTTLATVSTCMNDLLAVYMVNGTLPANNTLCEVDKDFALFSGVNTEDILAHLPSADV
ncbi:alpha/beta-hydrolase [Polyporus arcularius HHB13444]|uniref:Alpha/beta-hydrolase n=1 Tax=Polyporus arcularius HHB13444 TaxID=1314778 RepID=A0A5C3P3E8_9APHY|nr:alpha/beta-hydrolase [Polyporus arcularius HHB13444]